MSEQTQAEVAVMITATKRRDPKSHYTWLDTGGTRLDDKQLEAQLFAEGWNWSRYRDEYRTNKRFPRIPAGITVTDGGTVDYSAERPDRLRAGAARHQTLSNSAYQRQDQIGKLIPLGQPVHPGSAGDHHRADLKRMHRLMDTCVAEGKIAEDLQRRADRSERLQAYKETPEQMSRRHSTKVADLKKLERNKLGWEKCGELDEWQRRVDETRAEIAELDAAIAAAGGIAADHVQVKPGDLIQMKGHAGILKRASAKSYTIAIVGRTPEWKLTLDRSWFQKVIATKEELEQQKAEAQA